ncbi:FAD:protein FMN transferase [Pseudoalteromonas sp. SWXJ133]|uniref:FAD:protein FMN transferase n=1 Tax=Pseudoalteromonas sp. SWXJ133 TaxID=2792069 RepID=UPI0018CEC484|nr:FAD:protein FMN transferase [Pseudoalteromonas sp. SWXJ133]MBH0019995.1 FAD:protein FMN transferase [Pseudoalteromonas sp. SWXJ133]
MNRVSTSQGIMAFLLITLTLLLSGCGEKSESRETFIEGKTMGTTYHIKYYDEQGQLSASQLQLQIDAVLKDVNQSMSTYIEGSEINTFNRLPANQVMPISEDFRAVISESIRLGESTKTLDVTMGPLIDLWGFGPDKKPTNRPSDEELASMVEKIGIDKLILDEQGLSKTVNGLELSFSATAKGYGIDKVAQLLESHSITNYMVEIGGELRIAGEKPNNQDWKIAIEQPDAQPGERKVHRVLSPGTNGIATSGDYRIFYKMDGEIYTHLIDPVTGMPIKHDLVSVTVLHPSAMTADGLATALTVMGMEKAQAYAQQHDLPVYLIGKSNEGLVTYSSPAFKPYL